MPDRLPTGQYRLTLIWTGDDIGPDGVAWLVNRTSAPFAIADVEHIERIGGDPPADPHADATLDLIGDLTDPDPCEFDHHSYCQAHGWFDPSCPHGRAQQLLQRRDATPR